MSKKPFALLILTVFSVFAQETTLPSIEVPVKKESDVRVLGFGSCSAPFILPTPGVGVSVRKADWSFDAGINGILLLNWANLTVSRMFFSEASLQNGSRSYVSVGAGPVALFSLPSNAWWWDNSGALGVTVPVRWGKEYQKGFFDVGVSGGAVIDGFDSHDIYPFICPEVRGGFRF